MGCGDHKANRHSRECPRNRYCAKHRWKEIPRNSGGELLFKDSPSFYVLPLLAHSPLGLTMSFMVSHIKKKTGIDYSPKEILECIRDLQTGGFPVSRRGKRSGRIRYFIDSERREDYDITNWKTDALTAIDRL